MTPAALLTQLRAQSSIIGAMALKFTAAGLSFLITFIIARMYGAEVSGEYALFSFTVLTFGTIAVFGNDYLLVRRMAGFLATDRLDLARLSYSHALRSVVRSSLLLGVLLLLSLPVFARFGMTWPFALAAACAMLIQSILVISNAAVRGTHRLVQSQSLLVAQHVVMVILIAFLVSYGTASPGLALALSFVAGLITAAGISVLYVRRLIRGWPEANQSHPDDGQTNSVKMGLTLALDMGTMWAALSLTGALLSVAEAGVFRVCMQYINVVAMFGTTLEGLMAPRLASQFAIGDIAASRRTLNRSALFLAMVGGIPLAAMAVFAEPMLGLMGTEFRAGATALGILALGQFMVLLAGAAGTALVMSGREDISLRLAVLSFAVVIPLMAVLTPRLGLSGAAVGLAAMWLIRYQGSNLFARRMLSRAQDSEQP